NTSAVLFPLTLIASVSPMPSFVMLRTADRRKSCGVSPVYVPYRPFFLALSPVLSSLPNPARTQAFCHALRKQPTGKITPIRRLSGIFFKRSTTVASSRSEERRVGKEGGS